MSTDPAQRSEIEHMEPLGRCPCGRRIYADREQCAVMHAEPLCKAFIELEPDEFLAYVRRARGISEN